MSADAAPASSATQERVAAALEGLAWRVVECRDELLTLAVERPALRAVLERLKQQAGFVQATLVTGVDLYPEEPRFELVHQLLSYPHQDRVRVRTALAGDDAHAPTCVDLWPGAAFMERECFDMFGIVFDGHQGLRRLLMPEGYGHHPLRKDFPHQGIEPDRLYREWDAERRAGWNPQS